MPSPRAASGIDGWTDGDCSGRCNQSAPADALERSDWSRGHVERCDGGRADLASLHIRPHPPRLAPIGAPLLPATHDLRVAACHRAPS